MRNRKTKNKNAITLIALVITIVIMLLLAAIAIQLTLGENGLIVKATKAKSEQAKSELYDVAKLEYLNLKTSAVTNNQPEPKAEAVLSETNFLSKYNIVSDNIIDKNGEVIETKENLLKELEKLSTDSDTPTIADEDKDKLILRINIKTTTNLELINEGAGAPIKAEFHDGSTGEFKYDYAPSPSITKTYTPGTYILKLFTEYAWSGLSGLEVKINNSFATIDIINWGKHEPSSITLHAVDKIYSPEPDLLSVSYNSAIFNKIPEDLFVNKQHTITMSSFNNCNNLTEIPENLFKNCVNVKYFYNVFYNCKNITSIPENLFKYNINATRFYNAFAESGITSIPENLFANNPNIDNVDYAFRNCTHLSNIPQSIINKFMSIPHRSSAFEGCTSASNYNSIPVELKRP